jgi:uncharacterized membrane protein (UPF0127 family)
METQKYCVYNQTSESFLSLSVTLGDNTFDRLKGLLSRGSVNADEGSWISGKKGWKALGLFGRRDLIYLDKDNRVVDVIEALPRFQAPPERPSASSLLALPLRTVYASQTQPGNQLLICVAEEMEFRLRSIPHSAAEAVIEPEVDEIPSPKTWAPLGLSRDRRAAYRKRWPRLIAYNSEGEELAVHGIRDISATGLYLMTEERWPLGAEVKMSLQRTDGLDDHSMNPITVQLRVSRWGTDGVGLEFLQADPEHTALVAMHVR